MNTQMILKLILRDFSVYRTRIIGVSLIVLLMGMFMIFINTNLSRMFTSGTTSFIIVTIIVPFLLELKNKSVWIHTASLPVTRKNMVIARFLISLFIITINLLIWIIVYNVLLKILHSDPKYALNSNMIIFVWMNLLMGLAIFYFAYFRFNFIVAIGFYLFSMIFPQLLQTILNRTTGFVLEDFNQPLGLSIMALTLFLFSFFYSIVHFRKKDL
ncbi:MAG: ABC-2 transporter permease [Flavobacteriaceae bacterium]|nr:ABC-2 transporter permease [Flavobacteriaceae bacterium]